MHALFLWVWAHSWVPYYGKLINIPGYRWRNWGLGLYAFIVGLRMLFLKGSPSLLTWLATNDNVRSRSFTPVIMAALYYFFMLELKLLSGVDLYFPLP